jgi:hypothetical protein
MMGFDKHNEGTFRIIRWRPGIRGVRRWIDLRTMTRHGELWFVTRDVENALGLTRKAFELRRHARLEGNTWGTTRAQWQGQGHWLSYISLTALTVVMAGRPHRLDRFFLRRLDSLEEVAATVGMEGLVVDLPRIVDHSRGAYLKNTVEHASA